MACSTYYDVPSLRTDNAALVAILIAICDDYPFVLSWSLLEALSAGCVIIGSDTAPVREVLNDKNGLLVPFFDIELLAQRVIEVLTYPRRFRSIKVQARQTILDQYDLVRICLPKMLAFIQKAS